MIDIDIAISKQRSLASKHVKHHRNLFNTSKRLQRKTKKKEDAHKEAKDDEGEEPDHVKDGQMKSQISSHIST